MKIIFEAKNGKKMEKSFNSINDYISFITDNNSNIKKIYESDMPYDDKPVELSNITPSSGWEQIDSSAFCNIDSPTKSTKNSQKCCQNDKNKNFDDNQDNFKKFNYNEDEESDEESDEKSDEKFDNKKEKVDESIFDDMDDDINNFYKSTNLDKFSFLNRDKNKKKSNTIFDDMDKDIDKFFNSYKKPKKKEENNEMDESKCSLKESSISLKDDERFSLVWNKGDDNNPNGYFAINDKKLGKEVYHSASKQNALKRFNYYVKNKKLDEGIKDYLPRAGFIRDDETDKKQGAFFGQGTDEQLKKAKIIAKVKYAQGDKFGRVSKADLDNFDDYYAQYKEIYGTDPLNEGLKDYLPRAGFIRDDETDKKQGAFFGQGTDEQIKKAKIIAKVKFANGDRMGRVSKADLDNFDDYYAQYKEIYGTDPLNEGIETQPDMFNNDYDKTYSDGRLTIDSHAIIDFMSKYEPQYSFIDEKQIGDELNLIYSIKNFDMNNIKKIKNELKSAFDNGVSVKVAQSQYAPEQKKLYIGFIEKPDELNEGFFNKKLSSDQLKEYVKEYFIYTFMKTYGMKYDYNTYNKIIQELTKHDKLFKKTNELVTEFIESQENRFPPSVIINALGRILYSKGYNTDIYDKALQDFKDEELSQYKE